MCVCTCMCVYRDRNTERLRNMELGRQWRQRGTGTSRMGEMEIEKAVSTKGGISLACAVVGFTIPIPP